MKFEIACKRCGDTDRWLCECRLERPKEEVLLLAGNGASVRNHLRLCYRSLADAELHLTRNKVCTDNRVIRGINCALSNWSLGIMGLRPDVVVMTDSAYRAVGIWLELARLSAGGARVYSWEDFGRVRGFPRKHD